MTVVKPFLLILCIYIAVIFFQVIKNEMTRWYTLYIYSGVESNVKIPTSLMVYSSGIYFIGSMDCFINGQIKIVGQNNVGDF